jgi:hypothetical protein
MAFDRFAKPLLFNRAKFVEPPRRHFARATRRENKFSDARTGSTSLEGSVMADLVPGIHVGTRIFG